MEKVGRCTSRWQSVRSFRSSSENTPPRSNLLIFFFFFLSFPLVPFVFSFSFLNSSVPTERDNEAKYLGLDVRSFFRSSQPRAIAILRLRVCFANDWNFRIIIFRPSYVIPSIVSVLACIYISIFPLCPSSVATSFISFMLFFSFFSFVIFLLNSIHVIRV